MKSTSQNRRSALALVVLSLVSPLHAGASRAQGDLVLREVWTGFGNLLPHRIALPDANGFPTAQIIPVLELDDLIDNVTPQNGVLPATPWPTQALLPNSLGGNHFISARFGAALDVNSVLDSSPAAAASSQLTGAITVQAVSSSTGQVLQLQGRAFVGGKTYAGLATGVPPTLPLQTWFSNSGASLIANAAIDNNNDGIADGLGFPGTEAGTYFQNAEVLADPNVFVFVMDADGDLATHESFPANFEIVIEMDEQVLDGNGNSLARTARVNASVGPDTNAPELRLLPPPLSSPAIEPGNGATGVDPLTTVSLGFTESVQVGTLGALSGQGPATLSAAASLTFGPLNQTTTVPFSVLPLSVFDLSTIVLTPAFPFPGSSSLGQANCGALNQIDVQLNASSVLDLSSIPNVFSASTFFITGEGPGLANAPVAPDAIYAGRAGVAAALSVIDLNGFGASTGNPTYDPTFQSFLEGSSNYPNNPNVKFQGSLMRPPLTPGNCTVDGGSAGVFTRTLDSNLDPNLAKSPVLLDSSDMALGASLDQSFNNAPAPFGCQGGGGNLCAIDGLKQVFVTLGGPNTVRPAGPLDPLLNVGTGVSNTVSWAPHPNPPPLVYPPLCVSPNIGGQEPTSIETTSDFGLVNLLAPGDAQGDPNQGVPPSGLLSLEQNAWFQGPSPPSATILVCSPYMIRQQVGQFLYVIDRVRKELVVLNSNRMTTIDRIPLGDPARLALAPNLDYVAITNTSTNVVSFVDINPQSASFHQVIAETAVGNAPLGIAWDSMNEDLLVCNQVSNDVSVLSAFDFTVRKVVSLPTLRAPFDVVITPRQVNFASLRNVYYGYILSRDGSLTLFESGPSGVNGWGYDDLIGQAPYRFQKPKAMQVDVTDLRSAVWVAHEGAIDTMTGQAGPVGAGAISHVVAISSVQGQLPLVPNSLPQFRNLALNVDTSLGQGVLTGIPVDLAFDNQRNFGALPNASNVFSAGSPAMFNGKSLVRDLGTIRPANNPAHLFVAVPSSSDAGGGGAVDVIRLASLTRHDTNAFQTGVQSVPMPGVRVLMDYFRQ